MPLSFLELLDTVLEFPKPNIISAALLYLLGKLLLEVLGDGQGALQGLLISSKFGVRVVLKDPFYGGTVKSVELQKQVEDE